MEFLWRIFPLLRSNRLYAIFNTGLKKMASSIRNIFMSSSTRSTGFGSVCHEPCPTTNFFFSFFRWREEGTTSVLGSQPITWLLSPPPWSGDFLGLVDVTQVRLLRTDSLTLIYYHALTVILWWLATVNLNKRIAVIIFLSSQWDTTWQYIDTSFLVDTVLVWFGLDLWHINYWRLFIAKSIIYI